jgi:deoxycytidine triphosphate deaminase
MARILSDREIRGLLTDVIKDGDASLLNPNGIELRLGQHVRFLSTGEEMDVPPGHFVRVRPGETVMVASLEYLDFTRETVGRHFPGKMLMSMITPTTTMVREGIIQAATKVDAGFRGQLNWGFRNSSYKDLVLQNGESIFKLTLFLLEDDEVPEMAYGERNKDQYQDTQGVLVSRRRIPADVPKNKTVCSSFDQIDPKKQLREAGHPFDHIGSELISLQGKFEMVSKDFVALKADLDARSADLTQKIEAETKSVVGKIEETKSGLKEHAENLFSSKFTAIVGTLIGAVAILYGTLKWIQGFAPPTELLVFLSLFCGVVILLMTWIISKRTK